MLSPIISGSPGKCPKSNTLKFQKMTPMSAFVKWNCFYAAESDDSPTAFSCF